VSAPDPSFVHVCNGHATSWPLARSGVPGTFLVCADPLLIGPCPPLWGQAWRRLRLDVVLQGPGAADQPSPPDEVWDDDFERLLAGPDEIVLWYEHDLYCQLLLVRLLALVARHQGLRPPVSLVSIDRHPEVPNFKGLGELSAAQLAALFPGRRTIDDATVALGRDAWACYSDPDPRQLESFLARDLSGLPFLARALRRHLAEFPGASDGLSRSERRILELVAGGTSDVFALWLQLLEGEDCFYLTDDWFGRTLEGLAELLTCPRPLLPLRAGRATAVLTDRGQDLLAGRHQHRPTPRWVGGVQLPSWRWDGARLVPE
jgi:hypothetical protein